MGINRLSCAAVEEKHFAQQALIQCLEKSISIQLHQIAAQIQNLRNFLKTFASKL